MTSSIVNIIKPEELSKKDLLGRGSYHVVFKGEYNGKDVAIKEVINQEFMTEENKKEFEKKVNATYKFQHETILSVVGAVFTPGKLALVTEFCPYGDLEEAMKKYPEQFNHELKLKCLINISDALKYLHENNVIHRDIKPSKILIVSLDPKSPVVAKLSVFGTFHISEKVVVLTPKYVGTPLYKAPEVLSGSITYDKPVDVYSFSLVLYYVFTGHFPFEDDPRIKNVWTLIDAVISGKRPEIPSSFPTDIKELMEKCWDGDPSKRPTFEMIHSTLQKMDHH